MSRPRSAPCAYPVPLPRVPADDRTAQQYQQAAQRLVGRLAQWPGRPAAMAAFDELLSTEARAEQIKAAGRPVVGYLCNFVPDELVLAAGAVPLRLDLGLGHAAQAGARVLSGDICPEVRAIVGAHLGRLPYFELSDVLLIPTSCDGKKKLPRVLDREVWVLDLPHSAGGVASQQRWWATVKGLVKRLERLTGQRVRRGPLAQAIELCNRRTALMRRLNEQRAARPGLLRGQDALLVAQASFVADPGWWVEQTQALVQQLERAADPPGPAPLRIMVTGSPVLFPEFKLLELVEQHGAVVVADEMCSGTQHLYNPTVMDERSVGGMIRAAADRTLLPCTCPCFVEGDSRITRVLDRAARAGVDGVVHHTLRLCQLFDMEFPALAAALKEQVGLPVLNITTEYGADTDAQLIRNRVEAFCEMLEEL